MIKDIVAELYASRPRETLYHYTTFKGVFGIVQSKALWASDIRYMNDSAELRHTVDLIKRETRARIDRNSGSAKLLNAFGEWLNRKLTHGHLLFAASFRENGNLLSQWRGYSTVGKGVSLGFDPAMLEQRAQRQGFKIARCVYVEREQKALISQLVDAVEFLANDLAEVDGKVDYLAAFAKIETDLLTVAAVLKHPSFEEEAEWRVISPVYSEREVPDIKFREGSSMIVPHVEFSLADGRGLGLQHAFLGPSPNSQNSIDSLGMFLRLHDAEPKEGISDCMIPYRLR